MTIDPTPERPESSEPTAPVSPATRGARPAFRRWRRTRPFWAALWTGAGGFVIFFLPMAPLGKILQVGVGGIAGMAGGIVLMAMALLILLLPGQRHTAGVIAVIAGVASFPLSNLGGLFLGMFLSVLGGSMAFAWLPEKPARRRGGLLRRTRPGAETPVPAESVGSGSV
ncbi:hypothetical protein AQF52_1342 [Streptomyces venezuelae]|uniref:DUF6114 domain-containing protein n=1 Tax=Streptomyces gardneri TaxID=66892 RepID=UPI0006BC5A38|nr:DUF6114 domain-containing protein [Streptomyces gardneri]ALO06938.1 hypothetical protein AQF52_1342 [Streptomyces venezuelae]QPK44311.1 hypothetical protein H4W23_06605 [Streptomyces gardneri]WRK35602.1 DUF6114 domain-containing protein [Streptomyces venezuelae]CUM42764.1 putative membrane protein [Streptomyces venezuelae]